MVRSSQEASEDTGQFEMRDAQVVGKKSRIFGLGSGQKVVRKGFSERATGNKEVEVVNGLAFSQTNLKDDIPRRSGGETSMEGKKSEEDNMEGNSLTGRPFPIQSQGKKREGSKTD